MELIKHRTETDKWTMVCCNYNLHAANQDVVNCLRHLAFDTHDMNKEGYPKHTNLCYTASKKFTYRIFHVYVPILVKNNKGEMTKMIYCDRTKKSQYSVPLVQTTGVIPPKILQGNSFSTLHPSASFIKIDILTQKHQTRLLISAWNIWDYAKVNSVVAMVWHTSASKLCICCWSKEV